MLRTLFLRFVRWAIVDRHAGSKDIPTLQRELETNAKFVADRIGAGADTPKNRAQTAHLIGIEVWAQRRLRVALGEAFNDEEYDGYRPADDLSLRALHDVFLDARHNTLVLAAELHDANVDPAHRVAHNTFGPLAVRSWLQYLIGHGRFESKRLKPGTAPGT